MKVSLTRFSSYTMTAYGFERELESQNCRYVRADMNSSDTNKNRDT